MISTPLSLLNCPTRRRPVTYATQTSHFHFRTPLIGGPDGDQRAATTTHVARSDYAANAGVHWVQAPAGALHTGSGPADYGTGAAQSYYQDVWAPRIEQVTGVISVTTQFSPAHVRDGLSNTYLVGEKYLDPDRYTTGTCAGDNESMYMGTNPDIERFTFITPWRDQSGYPDTHRWGSAHPSAFNMAFCDGSVRHISFSINSDVHLALILGAPVVERRAAPLVPPTLEHLAHHVRLEQRPGHGAARRGFGAAPAGQVTHQPRVQEISAF